MQGIQRSKDEISSALRIATRMAQKYGQIGLEDPDDICQNVMLKVLKRTDDREVCNGWLYKCVHSAAMNAGRRRSYEARYMCSFTDDENNRSVCELADDQGYLHTNRNYTWMEVEDPEPDLIPRLKNVLKELTKPLRQVLILHAEGYSDDQIAQMTNTKRGTVRSRLHYARRYAKKSLGDLG